MPRRSVVFLLCEIAIYRIDPLDLAISRPRWSSQLRRARRQCLVWPSETYLPSLDQWLTRGMADIPDTVSLPDFILDNKYRSVSHEQAKNPFTCGLSGKTYTSLEWKDRIGSLAKAVQQELGFQVNNGTEWEKVVGVYTLNTVRFASPFRAQARKQSPTPLESDN